MKRTQYTSLPIGIMEQGNDGILGTFVFHRVENNTVHGINNPWNEKMSHSRRISSMVDLEPILKSKVFFLIAVLPSLFCIIPCVFFLLTTWTHGGFREAHYGEVLLLRETDQKLLLTERASDFFLLHGQKFSSIGTDQGKSIRFWVRPGVYF